MADYFPRTMSFYSGILLFLCVPNVFGLSGTPLDLADGDYYQYDILYNLIPAGLESILFKDSTTMSINSYTEMEQLKKLYKELFDGYDTRIRPRLDLTTAVHVMTKFVPHTIVSLDTVSQVFTISGYFQFEWIDEVLARTSLNGSLIISSQYIWLPSMRFSRAAMKKATIGNKKLDLVELGSKGGVKWVPEGIYSFICEVNTKHYPFDVHTCTLTYYTEGETLTTVDLNYYSTVDLGEYIPSAQWDIVRAYQETRVYNNVTFIDINFVVKRRGIFAAMVTLTPILIMSLLSSFPVLLPISSGEKCIISIMIFFGYTIFMTVMIDSLPHNSLHVSYLVVFVTYLLSVSAVLAFYAIIQQKIYWDFMNTNTPVTFLCKIWPKGSHKGNLRDKQLIFKKSDIYAFLIFSSMNAVSSIALLIILMKDY